MALAAEQFLIAVFSLMCFPLFAVLILTVVLASAGKSLGIRQLYVSLLLKIFEFVRVKLAVQSSQTEEPDSDEEQQHPVEESLPEDGDKPPLDGKRASLPHVIKRDFHLSVGKGLTHPDWEPFKKDFELSDICYFSKCGMEIETLLNLDKYVK